MRHKTLLYIVLLALLLILAGCAKAECKKDEACVRTHFTGTCEDKKCVWEPIPGECGNLECEPEANENKCVCTIDCGDCEGTAGKYLKQTCNAQDECVQDIPATAQKPISQTKELSTGGSKVSLTSVFNQPFNLKKDQVELDFSLSVLAKTMSELQISRLELTGTTSDRRTVSLADKSVNKFLHGEGSKVKEWLIVDFPTAETDGELKNLKLNIHVDYTYSSGTTVTPKSTILKQSYGTLKFVWANPESPSGCPDCDDGNPGTNDVCDESTNFFCEYKPKANACGNYVCDSNENKCSCPRDCGPCAGTIGTYLSSSCIGTNCVTQLKPGVTKQPQSIFDERDLGPFTLQNNYKFNKPMDITEDKVTLEFTLYAKEDSISSFKIKDIRLLEGSQERAYVSADKELTTTGQKETVEIDIADLGTPEHDASLTLKVWYDYVKDGETVQGDYTKSLGKITLVNPDA